MRWSFVTDSVPDSVTDFVTDFVSDFVTDSVTDFVPDVVTDVGVVSDVFGCNRLNQLLYLTPAANDSCAIDWMHFRIEFDPADERMR